MVGFLIMSWIYIYLPLHRNLVPHVCLQYEWQTIHNQDCMSPIVRYIDSSAKVIAMTPCGALETPPMLL